MRTESGTIEGDLRVEDDFTLQGMVTGDVTVGRGGHLELQGMVAGGLKVEDGATAVVRGMVAKDVLNAGHLTVYGMVIGRLDSTTGASTTIVRGAHINGEVHPGSK